jgi:hypothetical protein
VQFKAVVDRIADLRARDASKPLEDLKVHFATLARRTKRGG